MEDIPARTATGYFASTSVSNTPAATAVTATPSSAHLPASSLVRASTVALADPEWAIPGIPWWGERVTLTIVPPRPREKASSWAASDMLSMPSTFNLHTALQPFAAISSAGLKNCPPALFTSRSKRPWRSRTEETSRAA